LKGTVKFGFTSVQITSNSDSRKPERMCAQLQVVHKEAQPLGVPPFMLILLMARLSF
jgi:hypothetical protein